MPCCPSCISPGMQGPKVDVSSALQPFQNGWIAICVQFCEGAPLLHANKAIALCARLCSHKLVGRVTPAPGLCNAGISFLCAPGAVRASELGVCSVRQRAHLGHHGGVARGRGRFRSRRRPGSVLQMAPADAVRTKQQRTVCLVSALACSA